jgi:hypothetical protein
MISSALLDSFYLFAHQELLSHHFVQMTVGLRARLLPNKGNFEHCNLSLGSCYSAVAQGGNFYRT